MPRAKLSDVSMKQLVAELERRMSKLASLIAQRDALNMEIEELGAVSGAPGVAPAPTQAIPAAKLKAKRAIGKPLADFVTEALTASPEGLSVKAIEVSVRKAGYPTKAESLYNPIMKVLAASSFKKVQRGVYAAAGTAKAASKVAAGKAPAKVTAKTTQKAPAKAKGRKRGTFSQTADEMILGLVKEGGQTTAQLTKAWMDSGRGGKVDNPLSKLFKAGRIKRKKLGNGEKGSTYTLA